MPESVLEAIKRGDWEYEPRRMDTTQYEATDATPGSREKLAVLSERLERGLPLWHPRDRISYEESNA